MFIVSHMKISKLIIEENVIFFGKKADFKKKDLKFSVVRYIIKNWILTVILKYNFISERNESNENISNQCRKFIT